MNLSLCPDATPGFLGFFDLSIAPPFLFYVYIPILAVSVFLGLLILRKDQGSAQSKYFFWITVSFAVWIFITLFQWVAAHLEVVHLAWQFVILPEISIFLFSLLFAYAFLFKKDISDFYKYLWVSLMAAVALALPTHLNIDSFDITNCEGIIGVMWPLAYIFELTCIAGIVLITLEKLRAKAGAGEKLKATLFSIGLVFFLSIFWISNYFGEVTKIYEINFVGPVGMILFLSLLSYIIVRFKTFNTKLFASQILVGALWSLIAALLFIQKIEYVQIVVLVTLGFVTVLGFQLVRSVQKEIEQKEKLEELSRAKSEFMSIASHQLRTPLSIVKGYVSLMQEGSFGETTEKQKEVMQKLYATNEEMMNMVNDLLNVTRAEEGRLQYNFEDADLRELAAKTVESLRGAAATKKLELSSQLPAEPILVSADKEKLGQVISNLVDNAIKYTSQGSVTVQLSCDKGMALVKVLDTGLGIGKEEMGKLFESFSRGKAGTKSWTKGTGLGLYIAKRFVQAHGGKIWAESDGEGRGSAFFVELPLLQKS